MRSDHASAYRSMEPTKEPLDRNPLPSRTGRSRSWLCGLLIGLCSCVGIATVATPRAAAQERRLTERVTAVIGSCGAKVRALAGNDLSAVLRSALLKGLRDSPSVRVFEDARNAQAIPSGFGIDGSVTQLSRRNNAQGDIEVSADVSLIISSLPGRRVVAMVSGGATVIGSPTADTHFTGLLIQNLQQEAIAQAAQQATESWIESLERKNQRKTKLYAMTP